MSFNSETKKELTTVAPGKKCCQLAEISGFLKFGGIITLSGGPGIKVQTDNPAVARLFVSLIKDYFGTKTALAVLEPVQLQTSRQYELRIVPEMNSESILRETGILGVKEGSNIFETKIPQNIIKKRCCKKAMLRGIFLAAGSITDPNKGYHLEITHDSEEMARDLVKLINSFGLKAKMIPRRNRYVVYIKDGEQIEDFLSIIGVSGQLFKLQNVRITKEMRNTANRIINCENANLDKAVAAAQRQIADIRYIESRKGLEYLNSKLRETAVLRLENPDLPLEELRNLFEPPITKSGLNHRLTKISEIAANLQRL